MISEKAVVLGLAAAMLLLLPGLTCWLVDTTPPAVAILTPLDDEVFTARIIPVAALASDSVATDRVEFYVDDTLTGVDRTGVRDTFRCNWDASHDPCGTYHRIKAVAYDRAGNTAADSTVTVWIIPDSLNVDSLNCHLVGRCESMDSGLSVAVEGGYAYVADRNCGLHVIDVSNPQAPHEIGHCSTPDMAMDIAVSGSYVYVADRSCGLRVIDVSNPQAPKEAGHCSRPKMAFGVAVAGKYAYVADCNFGLYSVDVSDPQNPHVTSRSRPPGSLGEAVAASASYVYLAPDFYGLGVYDVSNRLQTREVGSCEERYPINKVAVAGGYAYAVQSGCGLRLIDVSNPMSPRDVSLYDPDPLPSCPWDIAVAGRYAFVAERWRNASGLRVIDVSSPQNPSLAGFYWTGNDCAYGVAVAGKYVYLLTGSGSLLIIEFQGQGIEEGRTHIEPASGASTRKPQAPNPRRFER